MLGGGKFENKTVSPANPVVSIGGIGCVPDYGLDTLPSDYDAVILIGGLSWKSEAAESVKPLVDDCMKRGKVLAAVCDACRFLGAIGALNDVKHTANDLRELTQYKEYTGSRNFVPRQAVSDRNVITANGTATLEFAREVLRALAVADDETIRGWYDFHKLGFYTAAMPQMG